MKDVDDNLLSDSTNMAKAQHIHFYSLYKDSYANGVRSPNISLPNITETTYIELMITKRDIENAISEIKCSSACRPDGIPGKLIKTCAKFFFRIITYNLAIFDKYWSSAYPDVT